MVFRKRFWRRGRFYRFLLRGDIRCQRALGLTLVEMALAITVTTTLTLGVSVTMAEALRLQTESGRVALAVSLARVKMDQLLTSDELSIGGESGEFGEDGGPYRGYAWEWEVKEERIDLAEVGSTGEISGIVEDQLPTGVTNSEGQEKLGQSESTATGGLVDITRGMVKITYPRGEGQTGEYKVETFRETKKTE